MSSSVKKVVDYHIKRLVDKDPQVRLKSIKELELLGHPDALEPLRDLFQNENNAEVRKAAQEAGRSIYLKNNNVQQDA